MTEKSESPHSNTKTITTTTTTAIARAIAPTPTPHNINVSLCNGSIGGKGLNSLLQSSNPAYLQSSCSHCRLMFLQLLQHAVPLQPHVPLALAAFSSLAVLPSCRSCCLQFGTVW